MVPEGRLPLIGTDLHRALRLWRDRRAGRGELESLDNPDGEEQAADPAGLIIAVAKNGSTETYAH